MFRLALLILLGLLLAPMALAEDAPVLPGVWVEVESGQGGGGALRPDPLASGGVGIGWWGTVGQWRSLTLRVPQTLPAAMLYLRHQPWTNDDGPIDAYLAPHGATTKDDPGARLLGRFSGDVGRDFQWAALSAGKVAAGDYTLFLYCPGPTKHECTLDIVALLPVMAHGLWLPPNQIDGGKLVGAPTVLSPLTIAPLTPSAPNGRYTLPADGTPVTAGFTLAVTNNSALAPAGITRVMTLTAAGGAVLWARTADDTLKPGETKSWEVALPPTTQSAAGVLTVKYRLDGKPYQTDTATLVVTKQIAGLADILAADGTLKSGYYEGKLTITAPVKLEAARLGAFILYGTIAVTGTHDVTLTRLVLHKDMVGTAPVLQMTNTSGCTITECRLWSSLPPDQSSQPSVLLADTCTGLRVTRSMLLGSGTVARLSSSGDSQLRDAIIYPDQFVGAQYGRAMRFQETTSFVGLRAVGCRHLVLDGCQVQAPGREGLALTLHDCPDWQGNRNTYWGVLGLATPGVWTDRVARTLADWRELAGQDRESKMAALELVRSPLLGAAPDPHGVLTGVPTVHIPLPAVPPLPGTTYALGIFDNQGRLVRSLRSEVAWQAKGLLEAHWDGTDNLRHAVPHGTYSARVYQVRLNARQGWLGNSHPTFELRFQHSMDGLYVAPDGRAYTNCGWDEMGRESAVYGPDGAVLATMPDTHGWGNMGGSVVTAGEKYVFVATTLVHVDDPRGFPPEGETWYGVKRYTRDGNVAAWPEGQGAWWRNQYVVGVKPCVAGLAARDGKLFIADAAANRIRVLDQDTMKEVRTFAVDRPGALALDAANNLWIIRTATADQAAAIIRVTPEGRQTLAITGVAKPAAIAVYAKDRVLVADNATSQVLTFDVTGDTATQVAALGEPGGIWGGPHPGATGDLRFHDLTGVGADAAGNVWVGMANNGAELKKFGPDGTLRWTLEGLTFVDGAAADPTAPEDVYTKDEHYRLDYATTPPSWHYAGFTHPQGVDDPRDHSSYTSVQTARIGGKLFLYLSPMYAQHFAIFRVDGEQVRPVGIVQGSRQAEAWPPNQPTGRWAWRDVNGDGQVQADEFTSDGTTDPDSWNWHVDANGDIWRGYSDGHISHLPCQGLDAHNNPIYDWAKAVVLPTPAPFQRIRAVVHTPSDDALYIYGATSDFLRHPADGWGPAGVVLARYDMKKNLRWQTLVDTTMNGMGCAVAGRLAFSTDLLQAEVQVFDAETGLKLGTLGPGKLSGYLGSWIDFPMSLQAVQRKDGEVVLFNEDDWTTKVVLYRLQPEIAPVGKPITVRW